MKFLNGRKTYIISTLMVLAGLVHLVSGDITLVDFLNSQDLMLVLNGLGIAALRAGIK